MSDTDLGKKPTPPPSLTYMVVLTDTPPGSSNWHGEFNVNPSLFDSPAAAAPNPPYFAFWATSGVITSFWFDIDSLKLSSEASQSPIGGISFDNNKFVIGMSASPQLGTTNTPSSLTFNPAGGMVTLTIFINIKAGQGKAWSLVRQSGSTISGKSVSVMIKPSA